MKNEALNTNSSDTIENGLPKASFQYFDLPVLINEMKQEGAWTKGNLNAKILSKNFDNQVVLTQLANGAEIKTFQSNDSVCIYLIEGKLKFYIGKKVISIQKGQFFLLNEKVKYKLKADETTVFLLIISNLRLKSDQIEVPWCI